MKDLRTVFLISLLFFASPYSYAQIGVLVQQDTIHCCSESKWIDAELDSQFDLQISSTILTDIGYYYARSAEDTKVSSLTAFGESFSGFDTLSTIAIGSVGCAWNLNFQPGDPDHYLGIQRYIGSDTLWSYIRLEFSDNDPNDNNLCNVKIVVKESAYQTLPNQSLMAGEGMTVSTALVDEIKPFHVYPNPARQSIYWPTDQQVLRCQVYHQGGQLIFTAVPTNNRLDLSSLINGVYFLRVWTSTGESWQKLLKIN